MSTLVLKHTDDMAVVWMVDECERRGGHE